MDKASRLIAMKYAATPEEDFGLMSWRVALHVSTGIGGTHLEIVERAKVFHSMMMDKRFLPGGRILRNAGTAIKNLYNCFFFDLEDSRESIYTCLRDAAEVFAWGGGLGVRVSNLRESGALINTSQTPSSGPMSFLELFNMTGEVIQQASRRKI